MASPKALKAASREKVGKGAARAVRRDNQIPAVIYGGGEAPTPISLDFKTANQLVYAGHFLTTVFEIEVGGTNAGDPQGLAHGDLNQVDEIAQSPVEAIGVPTDQHVIGASVECRE